MKAASTYFKEMDSQQIQLQLWTVIQSMKTRLSDLVVTWISSVNMQFLSPWSGTNEI